MAEIVRRNRRRRNRRRKKRRRPMAFFSKEEIKLIENRRKEKERLEKARIAEERKKQEIEHIERYGRKKERLQEALIDKPLNKIRPPVITRTNSNNESTKDENLENNLTNSKENDNIEEIVRDRLKKEQETERSLNKIKADQIKLNKQIHASQIENNFLYNKVPLEEVSILPENLTKEQEELKQKQQTTVIEWIDNAIEALKIELNKVKNIMGKLAYDHIEKIKKDYNEKNKEFNTTEKSRELRILLDTGIHYAGNRRAGEFGGISPIGLQESLVNDQDLPKTLPKNMKTEAEYEQLEKNNDRIWIVCRHGHRTFNSLRNVLTTSRVHHLNYFYNGTYEKLENCWCTIGLLNSNIKYLYEIKSGFADGTTEIIIPKQ